MAIDVAFDFRTDTTGPDPDRDSPTLRQYHRLLWSKRVPGGASFDLADTDPDGYLDHHSELWEHERLLARLSPRELWQVVAS